MVKYVVKCNKCTAVAVKTRSLKNDARSMQKVAVTEVKKMAEKSLKTDRIWSQ